MCRVTVYRRYEKPQQGFKVLLSARKTTVFTKTCNAPFLTVGLFLFLLLSNFFSSFSSISAFLFHFFICWSSCDWTVGRTGPLRTSIQTLLSKTNILSSSRVLYLKFCSSNDSSNFTSFKILLIETSSSISRVFRWIESYYSKEIRFNSFMKMNGEYSAILYHNRC